MILRAILILMLFASAAAAVSPQDETFILDDSCLFTLVDPLNFTIGWSAPLFCFSGHSVVRDPWSVADQTPGVDNDRYDVGGQQSATQSSFFSRGSGESTRLWFYDRIEITDPVAVGASGTFFDYEAMETLEIFTGETAVSFQSGGPVVKIVSRSGASSWSFDSSIYFSGDEFQSNNTPLESAYPDVPLSGNLDSYLEFGGSAGGKLVSDKLFVWAAYRRNRIKNRVPEQMIEDSELNHYTLKVHLPVSPSHDLQFEYFRSNKTMMQRSSSPAQVSRETLWTQSSTDTILPGIWKGSYSWTPNQRWHFNALYGYVGAGFKLVPLGGTDQSVIYFPAIPRYEGTYTVHDPIDRPSHQITTDASYHGKFAGLESDLKFGFEYRTSTIDSSFSYGNGVLIVDSYQTTPGGPLTHGYLYAERPQHYKSRVSRTSLFVQDTLRWKRWVLSGGLRFDHQSGENRPITVASVPGFESWLPAYEFEGNSVPAFSNWSPRVDVSFDVTGKAATIVKGSYARYHDPFHENFVTHGNPAANPSGLITTYSNRNGDREITPDEFLYFPDYYGSGLCHVFDDVPCYSNSYDENLKNTRTDEFVVSLEQQLPLDSAFQILYMHRKYSDHYTSIPEGLTTSDYVPGRTLTLNTTLGVFQVPLFRYVGDFHPTYVLTNVADYSQEYNGLDLTFRKRAGKYIGFAAGLVLQEQEAIYDSSEGLAFPVDDGRIPGEVRPLDPAQSAFVMGQPYAYSYNGVYPYSHWQLKVNATGHLPAGIDAGVFVRYQQGYPYVLFASVSGCGPSTCRDYLVLLEPFGARRYENLFSIDLQMRKQFETRAGRFTALLDIGNLTNTSTVTQRQRLANSDRFNSILDYVSPRVFRIGFRYSF